MRILITGAYGQLGRDLTDALAGRVPDGGRRCALLGPEGPREGLRHEVLGTDIDTMRVDERDAVLQTFLDFRPQLVLHGGAFTAVDLCESEVDAAYAVNAIGTRNVAEAAALVGAHVVAVSTDYVFDGTGTRPYREWDPPCPTSVYGASKLAGERELRQLLPGSTVVRTSWLCGAHGKNMVVTALRLAEGEGELRFVDDQHGSPTFTADLAPALITLGLDRRPGIFHVTNSGATTWCGFVRAILAEAGADPERVKPIRTADRDDPAPRPAYSVLDNMALRLSGLPALPDWRDGMSRLVRALRADNAEAAA